MNYDIYFEILGGWSIIAETMQIQLIGHKPQLLDV